MLPIFGRTPMLQAVRSKLQEGRRFWAGSCRPVQIMPVRLRRNMLSKMGIFERGTALFATESGGSPAQTGLESVRLRIKDTVEGAGISGTPRLVAVSKTKPVEMLMACYDAGHRDFGENYVQELLEKGRQMPDDVRWRFIGHLQSGKAKSLVAGVPSLTCVESVDSVKLADKLNAACNSAGRKLPLGVMIQVDTSGEDTKSGVQPGEPAIELAKHILNSCTSLKLDGLMTIGAAGDLSAFDKLKRCREEVASALQVELHTLELSMGMSGDFEEAIRCGSTNVRVGSTIFGAREYKPKV
eukprot:gnl/MRDRNA2_/MRDRNA2_102587_c0_seq1.p1 gnl/MRDRNA2_/MRDRNA2_102587_c0~~gnl/MRDRNA2_/MRDRNA2_102587_c0_seq1.p1  ORF type:complete len:320 (+),score=54.22 gnl/MRDRNA2_/MRDRNA2_102587_c0_seq1:68-961(+)